MDKYVNVPETRTHKARCIRWSYSEIPISVQMVHNLLLLTYQPERYILGVLKNVDLFSLALHVTEPFFSLIKGSERLTHCQKYLLVMDVFHAEPQAPSIRLWLYTHTQDHKRSGGFPVRVFPQDTSPTRTMVLPSMKASRALLSFRCGGYLYGVGLWCCGNGPGWKGRPHDFFS